jgi:anti-anti-sigma regulatory factor
MGLFAVDVVARLHLAARRRGLELRIAAPPELRELIAFCGLDEVLRVELQRQPEQREERGGVEEERELLDSGA